MQYDPKNSIKIALADIGVGMFVTAIEHNKRVNLANAGRISSPEGIKKLATSGVKYVWVDQTLSSQQCVFKPVDESTDATNETREQKHSDFKRGQRAYRSRDIQHKRAKRLIAEAKDLAQKLLNQTFEGKIIEVDEVEAWADDVIESVLIDSDALQCVSALRKKDSYLLEHSVNVACLLVSFGKYLGLDKPTKLTPEEFEHMKLHQVFAGEIILHVKGLSDVSRDVCLMHHEKLDGNGYPRGLKGEEIPIHGRMSCIVDIYDALTADRCYKKGMSSAEAFKILLSLTPFHLDADLVYKFINCIGIYPVGSIVELNDGRVGIVWSSNESQALKPEVKCFYSRKYKRYIDVTMVDLKTSAYKIERAIAPSSLEIDPKPFYD
ncbi:DUF3391 domain-containing protein [Vibrio alginolyticus]|nr:DUF3391 domain-containing protein [Vibrio alginolyticus]